MNKCMKYCTVQNKIRSLPVSTWIQYENRVIFFDNDFPRAPGNGVTKENRFVWENGLHISCRWCLMHVSTGTFHAGRRRTIYLVATASKGLVSSWTIDHCNPLRLGPPITYQPASLIQSLRTTIKTTQLRFCMKTTHQR